MLTLLGSLSLCFQLMSGVSERDLLSSACGSWASYLLEAAFSL